MQQTPRPWWGIPWWIWALGCLAVAAVYAWADGAGSPPTAPGVLGWWLRWGHSLCWVLLGASFLVRMGRGSPWAGRLASAGGLAYAGFLVLKVTLGAPG